MTAYWTTQQQEKICVIEADNSITSVYLPIPGDPTSIGDHVDPAIRAACQTPHTIAEWDAAIAAITPPPAPPPAPLTPEQKLAAAGLTVAELQELLGLTP